MLSAVSCRSALAKGSKGPYVQNLTGVSVVICWETDEATAGKIFLKAGKGKGITLEEKNVSTFHEVKIDNLTPGTVYGYSVAAGKLKGGGTFHTDPLKPEPFTFAVYGDNRSGHVEHKVVANMIKKAAPVLVLNTGDMVGDGRKQPDWDMFWKIETPLAGVAAYYPTLGNHEKESDIYYKYFSLPDSGLGETSYSFTWAGAYFIALDNGSSGMVDQKQLKWLKQRLQEAQKYDFIFVFFHQPPYSSSKRTPSPTMKKSLLPVFEKYGVSAVFNGHDHFYERSEAGGIQYVVAGGGGAPLYDFVKIQPESLVRVKEHGFLIVKINGKTAVCEALNMNGKTVDTFQLKSPR